MNGFRRSGRTHDIANSLIHYCSETDTSRNISKNDKTQSESVSRGNRENDSSASQLAHITNHLYKRCTHHALKSAECHSPNARKEAECPRGIPRKRMPRGIRHQNWHSGRTPRRKSTTVYTCFVGKKIPDRVPVLNVLLHL